MNFSTNTDKLIPALLKAQIQMGGSLKSADNPFFKSKYADLTAVIDACKTILNAESILVIQYPSVQMNSNGENENFLQTRLVHESGQFVEGEMKLILQKNDMQQYGSAMTYARRYCLQTMVFLTAEDDDGEKSMGRTNKPQAAKPTRSTTSTKKTFQKPATKNDEKKTEPVAKKEIKKETQPVDSGW